MRSRQFTVSREGQASGVADTQRREVSLRFFEQNQGVGTVSQKDSVADRQAVWVWLTGELGLLSKRGKSRRGALGANLSSEDVRSIAA